MLKEIPMTANEKRDIIILRNELAYFLAKGSEGKVAPLKLPDPIDHPSCQRCPYNLICTSFLK